MKALRIIGFGLLTFALQNAVANCTSCTSPSDKPYYKMDPAIKSRDDKAAATNKNVEYGKGAAHPGRKKWIPRSHTTYPHYADRMLTVTMYPGSLKANIVRIANSCGWNTVIWSMPEDYVWVGHTQIVAPDLYKALFQILAKYPVQAQLYQGNRVVAIVPRNLP